MKKVISLICLVFLLLCTAYADGLNPYVAGSVTATPAGGSDLLDWRAENTYADGVSGTWVNSAEGSFSTTGAAPLEGTYSFALTQSADAGEETVTSPDISYTSGATVYGRFIHHQETAWDNYAGQALLRGLDSGATAAIELQFRGSALRLYQGTQYVNYFTPPSVDTTYYFWWSYTPDSGAGDGEAHVWVSATTTKPASPVVNVTNGDNGNDIQNVIHAALYNTGGGNHLYDQSQVSLTEYGDF